MHDLWITEDKHPCPKVIPKLSFAMCAVMPDLYKLQVLESNDFYTVIHRKAPALTITTNIYTTNKRITAKPEKRENRPFRQLKIYAWQYWSAAITLVTRKLFLLTMLFLLKTSNRLLCSLWIKLGISCGQIVDNSCYPQAWKSYPQTVHRIFTGYTQVIQLPSNW